MKKKISGGIFGASIMILMLSIILIMGVLYGTYTKQYEQQMENEAVFIAEGIETSGIVYLENLKSEFIIDSRITWIESDGTVIYDSEADAGRMENHLNRAEVQDALKYGEGMSRRYSDTLAESTCYYARVIDGGSVIRLSVTQNTLFAITVGVLPSVLLIIMVAVILSLVISSNLSRKITEPINRINLENPHESDVYPELTPLVEKIHEQNVQISNQMQELREQYLVRTEFTANVTHELKTPLTSILGFAEIMKSGIVKPADMQHFSEKIYDEAQRLLALIADILRLSKLESNTSMPEREDTDLLRAADVVAERLQSIAEKRGVKMNVSGEHAAVRVIPQILDEVIFNLAENAIKYNRTGGIVDIVTGYENERPVIRIRDTGTGIAPDDMPRIFERFYRADKAHSSEVPGTGLGLSIVKHGINVMGASIEVKSVPGEGTEMKVLF